MLLLAHFHCLHIICMCICACVCVCVTRLCRRLWWNAFSALQCLLITLLLQRISSTFTQTNLEITLLGLYIHIHKCTYIQTYTYKWNIFDVLLQVRYTLGPSCSHQQLGSFCHYSRFCLSSPLPHTLTLLHFILLYYVIVVFGYFKLLI